MFGDDESGCNYVVLNGGGSVMEQWLGIMLVVGWMEFGGWREKWEKRGGQVVANNDGGEAGFRL